MNLNNQAKKNKKESALSAKNLSKESNKPNKTTIYLHDALEKRLKEGLFIVLQIIAVFLLAAFVTYNRNDPAWSSTGENTNIINAAGAVGAWLADIMLYTFGYLAYLFPAMFSYGGWLIFQNRQKKLSRGLFALKIFGFMLAMLGGCGLANLHFLPLHGLLPNFSGGILGLVLSNYFATVLNLLGATLLFLTAFLVGITLATGLSWLAVADQLGFVTLQLGKGLYFLLKSLVIKGYFKTSVLHKTLQAKKLAREKFITPIMQANNKPAKQKKLAPIVPSFADETAEFLAAEDFVELEQPVLPIIAKCVKPVNKKAMDQS